MLKHFTTSYEYIQIATKLGNHGIKHFVCVAVVMPKGNSGSEAACHQKATTVIKGLSRKLDNYLFLNILRSPHFTIKTQVWLNHYHDQSFLHCHEVNLTSTETIQI